MGAQYSVTVNNARLDAIETAAGTNVAVLIYSGPQPANCAAAPTGTLLAVGQLPADWMTAASSATKAKNGTWTLTGVANGTAGHFRLCNASPTDVAQIQGNVDVTGASPTPVMSIDNTSIAVSQTVTVTAFNITAGNQ